ncbi:hypothetical protein FH972_005314 [Carpinus fangiana]|uniref:O-methyltransferase domain-containing protein n=1 Tax=Carpinus fangiana TaxID=176857 RepID=A0A5N6QNX5_9ROSI|nr:hypothetical protein FH972_005314 [Carpinus fangiana]
MAVVKCAIELEIADVIESHGSPMTLSELSSALACASSPLYRIMRFLMHRGIFKEELTAHSSLAYAQTALSRRLMRYGEHSIAAFIMLNSSSMVAHGEDAWSFLKANPAQSQLVNEAMASDARVAMPAIIHGCPEVFDGLGSLVDVGGGNGTTLQMLVKAFPWLRGIHFDLPHVVSNAVEFKGRCGFPNDKECIQILKKCSEAISEEKGKVIIVEAMIEEGKMDELSDARLALDMAMMARSYKRGQRKDIEGTGISS